MHHTHLPTTYSLQLYELALFHERTYRTYSPHWSAFHKEPTFNTETFFIIHAGCCLLKERHVYSSRKALRKDLGLASCDARLFFTHLNHALKHRRYYTLNQLLDDYEKNPHILVIQSSTTPFATQLRI